MMRTVLVALAMLAVLVAGTPAMAQGGSVRETLTREWMVAMDAMDTALEKGDYIAAERHLTTALQKARAIGAESEPLQLTHMTAVSYYIERKDFAKAETHGKAGLSIVEARTGKSSEDTAMALAMLTQVYMDGEMEDKAEAPAARALAILDKRPKDNAEMIAGMLSILAMAEQTNDRLVACDEHLTRLRELMKADGATGEDDYAMMLLHGGVQGVLGRIADGSALVDKAAAGLRKLKNADPELVLAAEMTVAVMAGMRGKMAEADRQVRALYARTAAKPTKDTIRLLDMMRGYQHDLGAIAEEERLLGLLRAAVAKVYGKDPVPPDTQADLAEAEADLLWNRGAYAEAEPLLRKAIALEQQRYPTGNGIANRKMSLALLLAESGRYDEAIALLREAKPLIEAGYGAKSLPGAIYLLNVGRIALERGLHDEAAPFLEAALALAETMFGADAEFALADVRWLIARVRLAQGRPADAKPLAEQAVKAVAAEIGTKGPGYAEPLLVLADCNRDLATPESLKAAGEQYAQVVAIQTAALPATHPTLATTYEHYARYLRAVKRDKEAAAYETKAAAIRKK